MANLTDFIHIHHNKLDSNQCDALINFFEVNSTDNKTLNLTDIKDFDENISSIHNEILKIIVNTRNEYYEYCFGKVFPELNSFEKFVIKKFIPEDNQTTDATVDIKTYEDARRFLCFTFYLNDNVGGQTKFLDLTIQPELGKLIVYPPFWLFPHKDLEPIDNPKYILTAYLHYK